MLTSGLGIFCFPGQSNTSVGAFAFYGGKKVEVVLALI
jgi:hypothetical protein